MGKSPGKWIKSVLLGKKSTKSASAEANESADNNNRYSIGEDRALSENSPVISEPVLVNVHKNVAVDGKAENASGPAGQQDLQGQSIVESKPSGPGQLGEDQAAAKAQAAFRGYLAAAQPDSLTLLSSPIVLEPLHFQYDKRDPNSTYNWFERWTIGCIWKPAFQPKRVADGKPLVKKASYAMEIASAKLKRNIRKGSAAIAGSFHTSGESDKVKWNPKKFSSFPADSVPDSQLSELEEVKRNLRKVTDSMAEASKISSSRVDSSKVCDSTADVPKESNPVVEISKIPSLLNGISDHQDIQGEKTRGASFPLGTQEYSDNDHLLRYSNMDSLDLLPSLKSDQEIQLDSVSIGKNVDDPAVVAPAFEEMPLQNIDTEDNNVLWNKEEARSKEDLLSNGSLRTSKRKSSFPNKSEYVENGTHTTTVQPRQPSYMAATESAKAKLRAQNSPRLDSEFLIRQQKRMVSPDATLFLPV